MFTLRKMCRHLSLITYNQKFFKILRSKLINEKCFENKYQFKFFHSNSILSSDNSPKDFKNDPEFQKTLKEMYEEFDKKNVNQESAIVDKDLHEKFEEKMPSQHNLDETASHQFHTDVIYDYDEENILREKGLWQETVRIKDLTPKMDYKRGTTGVFDVNELVDFLEKGRAQNIIVLKIPSSLNFVDHMIIVTGKSKKHNTFLAEQFRKTYKMTRHPQDGIPRIEGINSDWVALDMRNIILHIMLEDVRVEKDLESLWAVGPEFDEQSREFENPVYY